MFKKFRYTLLTTITLSNSIENFKIYKFYDLYQKSFKNFWNCSIYSDP